MFPPPLGPACCSSLEVCVTPPPPPSINLIAADTVILHDLDFNPHVDKQAEDRVHRMGQTKPVTVYRFVCAHTIDEAIVKIQSKKTELVDAVLQVPRLRACQRVCVCVTHCVSEGD